LLEINKTYNMDCIDGLKQMIEQKQFVDCIITDPPMVSIFIQIVERKVV
jgi:DNA modification methylase